MDTNTTTPYNTGRVRVGSQYAPPERVQDMGTEAERVQRALLRSANDSRLHSRFPVFHGSMKPRAVRFYRIGRRSLLWRALRLVRVTWRWLCGSRAW